MLFINAVKDPNYYLNASQELDTTLHWAGGLAESLELAGSDLGAYKWLAKGKTPYAEKLTRADDKDARRFYDLTFTEPKSVSLMEQLAGDTRIAQARRDSVYEVMEKHVEPLAAARVWNGIRQVRQTTGNLAYIAFEHKLARPVGGSPDPNGHIHVIVANATAVKGKRYALSIEPIIENATTIEAAWHANFAGKLRDLGYDITPTKNGFEIAGVPQKSIDTFSRRSKLIEKEAEKRHATPKQKAAMGAYTREKKAEAPSPKRIRSEWLTRLSSGERLLLDAAALKARNTKSTRKEVNARELAALVLEEALSQVSAIPVRSWMIQATRKAAGHLPLESAQLAVDSMRGGEIITGTIRGIPFVTTKAAREKERAILRKAQKGEIRMHRVKRGESYTPKEGETVIHTPTLDQLAHLSQSADSFTVTYPYRDYRKVDRGNPNVWLEDLGGLSTGQGRPAPAWQKKVERVASSVGQKAKRHIERVRRQAITRELSHGRERQADYGQERGVGI